jgi:hypothetical protein
MSPRKLRDPEAEETIPVMIYMAPDEHKALKLLAVKQETTMSKLVRMAVQSLLSTTFTTR